MILLLQLLLTRRHLAHRNWRLGTFIEKLDDVQLGRHSSSLSICLQLNDFHIKFDAVLVTMINTTCWLLTDSNVRIGTCFYDAIMKLLNLLDCATLQIKWSFVQSRLHNCRSWRLRRWSGITDCIVDVLHILLLLLLYRKIFRLLQLRHQLHGMNISSVAERYLFLSLITQVLKVDIIWRLGPVGQLLSIGCLRHWIGMKTIDDILHVLPRCLAVNVRFVRGFAV